MTEGIKIWGQRTLKGLDGGALQRINFRQALSHVGTMLKAKDWMECFPDNMQSQWPEGIAQHTLIVLTGFTINDDESISIDFAVFDHEKHGEMVRKKAEEW